MLIPFSTISACFFENKDNSYFVRMIGERQPFFSCVYTDDGFVTTTNATATLSQAMILSLLNPSPTLDVLTNLGTIQRHLRVSAKPYSFDIMHLFHARRDF